jgi:hypothetical protein
MSERMSDIGDWLGSLDTDGTIIHAQANSSRGQRTSLRQYFPESENHTLRLKRAAHTLKFRGESSAAPAY